MGNLLPINQVDSQEFLHWLELIRLKPQWAFTCSKWTMETPEICVKPVQS